MKKMNNVKMTEMNIQWEIKHRNQIQALHFQEGRENCERGEEKKDIKKSRSELLDTKNMILGIENILAWMNNRFYTSA